MYEVAAPHTTTFRFSRFEAAEAAEGQPSLRTADAEAASTDGAVEASHLSSRRRLSESSPPCSPPPSPPPPSPPPPSPPQPVVYVLETPPSPPKRRGLDCTCEYLWYNGLCDADMESADMESGLLGELASLGAACTNITAKKDECCSVSPPVPPLLPPSPPPPSPSPSPSPPDGQCHKTNIYSDPRLAKFCEGQPGDCCKKISSVVQEHCEEYYLNITIPATSELLGYMNCVWSPQKVPRPPLPS